MGLSRSEPGDPPKGVARRRVPPLVLPLRVWFDLGWKLTRASEAQEIVDENPTPKQLVGYRSKLCAGLTFALALFPTLCLERD